MQLFPESAVWVNLGECHTDGLSFWVVPSVFAKISLEIKANKGRQSQKH